MLTCKKLHEILNAFPQEKINSHVHTHLCDGRPDMTVANIAAGVDEAKQREKDGYFYKFQRYTMDHCRELGIPYAFGTDAHGLGGI